MTRKINLILHSEAYVNIYIEHVNAFSDTLLKNGANIELLTYLPIVYKSLVRIGGNLLPLDKYCEILKIGARFFYQNLLWHILTQIPVRRHQVD